MLLEKVRVSDEETHLRLDLFLCKKFPLYSRTYFQDLIQKKCVWVNGLVLKKKDQLKTGDEIVVQFEEFAEITVKPEAISLDILFEDEHILAINKPVGMVTHPAPGNYSQTFVNGLLHHCKHLPLGETLRPGIVHRLDKDTSGVLLAAKHMLAHQRLVKMFAERELCKKYLAICVGSPGDVVIEAGIKRHPIRRKEMAIDDHGKWAITKCRVVTCDGELSLVEVDLLTGRTHQIRVHLKHHKTPILGDGVYGSPSMNKKYGIFHQMLHAYALTFAHPVTEEKIVLKAPVPKAFSNIFRRDVTALVG